MLKSGDNFKTLGVIQVYKKNTNEEALYKCKNYDFDIVVEEVPNALEHDGDEFLSKYVADCMKEY